MQSLVLWKAPIAALITTGLMAACSPSDEANKDQGVVSRPVKVMVVERAETILRHSYPARILPAQEAVLSFRISGQILDLPIRAAQQVNKGDVIAKLDTRDLLATKAQLESQLKQGQAQLDAMVRGARAEDIAALKAGLAAAQAQLDAARQQVDRSQTLFSKGVITKTQLDQHVTNLKVAEAEMESRKQELAKGEAGSRKEEVDAQKAAISALKAQLLSANNNIDDATLRAPFTGIIASRAVENFANVQAKETIATLQRLNRLDLEFDIPGTDVSRFSNEEEPNVLARLDSLPGRNFEVELVDFNTQADTATQTFRARVSITPPKDATILPGMTGQIFVTKQQPGGDELRVPITAVAATADGQSFVWLVKDGKTVSQRFVTTGKSGGDTVAITKGLKAGETIAVAGLLALQEGMAVKPIAKVGE